MMIKAAIFDLDGTLLDSMPVWDRFGELYLASRGVAAPENLAETLKPMSLMEAAAYFRETFGFPETEDEIAAQFTALLAAEYRERVMLKPHALPLLQKLQKAGVKLCVATATDRQAAEAALKRLGVLECFDFVLTCDEAGSGKSSPEIYFMALARLGTLKAETVVFEDALHAARTAKAAGFPVVGVFDASAIVDRAELMRVADRYIDTFDEWEFDVDAYSTDNRGV